MGGRGPLPHTPGKCIFKLLLCTRSGASSRMLWLNLHEYVRAANAAPASLAASATCASAPLEGLESPRRATAAGNGRTSVLTPRAAAFCTSGPSWAAMRASFQSGFSFWRLAIISSKQTSAPPNPPDALKYWIIMRARPLQHRVTEVAKEIGNRQNQVLENFGDYGDFGIYFGEFFRSSASSFPLCCKRFNCPPTRLAQLRGAWIRDRRQRRHRQRRTHNEPCCIGRNVQIEVEEAVHQQPQTANGCAHPHPGNDVAGGGQGGAEVLAGLDKKERQGRHNQNAAHGPRFRQGLRIIVVGVVNAFFTGKTLIGRVVG